MVLIGGRGCGKSSVCRLLRAADKRFTLLNLDEMIARKAGTSIPEIVQGKGWVYFRELEFQVCREVAGQAVCDGEWLLIDAGGGVVVDLDEEGNEMYSTRKVGGLGKGNVLSPSKGFSGFWISGFWGLGFRV